MSQPTEEHLQKSVSVLLRVINQMSVFHCYDTMIAGKFDAANNVEITLKAMMNNAALDSTLFSLRCLDEFFMSGGQDDDVRAHHFQIAADKSPPFLTKDERADINKHLAHITTLRCDGSAKAWPIDDLVLRGLNRGSELLYHIVQHFNLPSDEVKAELQNAIAVLHKATKWIERR